MSKEDKTNIYYKIMNEEDKLKVQIARLEGEYIGTLKGILWWDIPNELKERLKDRIVELENQNKDE
jgi:hypothetical protein